MTLEALRTIKRGLGLICGRRLPRASWARGMPAQPQNVPVSLPPYAVEKVCRSLSLDERIDAQLQVLGIPETWTESQGEGVKVAILDTVGATGHPDLGGQIVCELCRDFTVDGLEDKGTFHGVFCSGLVGAREDQKGIIGVAPKCSLILVRALDNSGGGSLEGVRSALRYCLQIRPDVVSMSLGMTDPDPEIESVIRELYALNIPCIVAAGNDGRLDSVNYPAKYPETICVGAVDKDGRIAHFSSRGETVDILAPGCQIYSLYGKDSYSRMSGTSMATPIVAGIVALLIAKHRRQEAETGHNDCKTVEEIRHHLKKHAKPLGDPSCPYAGLVDPNASLADGEPVEPIVEAKGLPWAPTAWKLDNAYSVFAGEPGINWDSPDGWLNIRDGVWTIKAGYSWDGNSCVPDFLNSKDPVTGLPRSYYPSLCHDIGYRYLRSSPESFPYSKRQIDFFYFRLGRQYKFLLAWLYVIGVLLFGHWAI